MIPNYSGCRLAGLQRIFGEIAQVKREKQSDSGLMDYWI
jgi:hypothetical protein